MSGFLLEFEPAIRLGVFAAIFVIMAGWEVLAPRRDQAIGRTTRWPSNLGVVLLDMVLVRVLFPTSAVALALLAEAQSWGLMNAWLVPQWAAVIASVVVLD